MLCEDFVPETAANELAKKLPSLAKHDYDTIDKLMQKIARKHKISGDDLHNKFIKKYRKTPDNWIKEKLQEKSGTSNLNIEDEVMKFANWAGKKLKLKKMPKINLSKDTEEAQTNHHSWWAFARIR